MQVIPVSDFLETPAVVWKYSIIGCTSFPTHKGVPSGRYRLDPL